MFAKPLEDDFDGLNKRKIPKGVKILIVTLMVIVFVAMILLVVFGAIFLATGTGEDKRIGLITLLVGVGLIVAYTVFVIIRLNLKKRKRLGAQREKAAAHNSPLMALRKIVHVVVDRPLGSVHPNHPDILYDVNYGYVPGETGGDGEAQDAYILGVDEPIEEFDGVVIAVIHRLNDNEDKWVVAPRGVTFTDEEIKAKTEFQEKFFQTEIISS